MTDLYLLLLRAAINSSVMVHLLQCLTLPQGLEPAQGGYSFLESNCCRVLNQCRGEKFLKIDKDKMNAFKFENAHLMHQIIRYFLTASLILAVLGTEKSGIKISQQFSQKNCNKSRLLNFQNSIQVKEEVSCGLGFHGELVKKLLLFK